MKPLTRGRLATVALVAAALAWPASAVACACCANRGDHSQTTERIRPFELDELVKLRFGTVANLRQTPAFPANVRGIKPVAARYGLSQARHARIYTLAFRDAQGNTGTLGFVLPERATRLAVDPHDGRRAAGGGPLLYKEWRLQGRLTASGVFAGSGSPRFRLVIQGRGNSCVNARDFRNWILQVSGPRATYSFYGTFRAPA